MLNVRGVDLVCYRLLIVAKYAVDWFKNDENYTFFLYVFVGYLWQYSDESK